MNIVWLKEIITDTPSPHRNNHTTPSPTCTGITHIQPPHTPFVRAPRTFPSMSPALSPAPQSSPYRRHLSFQASGEGGGRREGGREGGREGRGTEGGRKGGRKGGREGGREERNKSVKSLMSLRLNHVCSTVASSAVLADRDLCSQSPVVLRLCTYLNVYNVCTESSQS